MTVTRKGIGCACMAAQSDSSVPVITCVISNNVLDISLEGVQGMSAQEGVVDNDVWYSRSASIRVNTAI